MEGLCVGEQNMIFFGFLEYLPHRSLESGWKGDRKDRECAGDLAKSGQQIGRAWIW